MRHDGKADVVVLNNGDIYPLQIKSGKLNKAKSTITMPGYRFGRFKGNFDNISDYPNNAPADVLAVPHEQLEDDKGRHHIYRTFYFPAEVLRDITSHDWQKHGAQYYQTNNNGVMFSLRPSMSWQV